MFIVNLVVSTSANMHMNNYFGKEVVLNKIGVLLGVLSAIIDMN